MHYYGEEVKSTATQEYKPSNDDGDGLVDGSDQ